MNYYQYEDQYNQYMRALGAQKNEQNSLAAALGNSSIQTYNEIRGVPIKQGLEENKTLLLLEA